MSTIREYTKGVASFDHQSLASFIEPKKEKRDQLLRLDRYVNPVDHPQLHKTLTKKITVIKQEASLLVADKIKNNKLAEALKLLHAMTIDIFRQGTMDPKGARILLKEILCSIKELSAEHFQNIKDQDEKKRCEGFVEGIEAILSATVQDTRPLEAIGHFCLGIKAEEEQKSFFAATVALEKIIDHKFLQHQFSEIRRILYRHENKNLFNALEGFTKIKLSPPKNFSLEEISSKEIKRMRGLIIEGITHALVREDVECCVEGITLVQQYHCMDASVLQILEAARKSQAVPVLLFTQLQGKEGHKRPLSSAMDKKGTVHGSQEGASNERQIVIDGEIAIRASGRTDSVKRQEKNALLGLQQVVEKEGVKSRKFCLLLNKKGDPIQDENGQHVLQYKPSIGTYQDVENLKWVLEVAQSFGEEKKFTEYDSVIKIFQSANDFQPFRVKVKERIIEVQRPLVQTASMNATARGESFFRKHLNALSIQRLEEDYHLQSKNFSHYEKTVVIKCLTALKEGVYLSLSEEKREKMHPADREIFRQTLLHILGYDIKVECKSGTDRTVSGFAIGAAIVAHKKKYGTYFLPSGPQPSKSKNEQFFAQVFTEVVEKFGLSMTTYTKGKFGIKWGLEYLLQGILPNIFYVFGMDKELVSPAPFRYLLIPDLQKDGKLNMDKRKIRLNPNWASQSNPLDVTDPNHLKAIHQWLQTGFTTRFVT